MQLLSDTAWFLDDPRIPDKMCDYVEKSSVINKEVACYGVAFGGVLLAWLSLLYIVGSRMYTGFFCFLGSEKSEVNVDIFCDDFRFFELGVELVY